MGRPSQRVATGGNAHKPSGRQTAASEATRKTSKKTLGPRNALVVELLVDVLVVVAVVELVVILLVDVVVGVVVLVEVEVLVAELLV